ncbi:MAG: hypothetical protein Tsb002_16570 [Wenzhouxiangellaceae bacterium]
MKARIITVLLLTVVATPVLATMTLSRAPMQEVVYLAEVASLRHQAETGFADAQFALGNQYYHGAEEYRLAQSYDNAWDWYLKAARQGHSGAAYNMAVMRIQGHGVQRDLIEALAWMKVAASQGHGASKELIPELESLLKPQQIRAAEDLSRDLVPAAAYGSSVNSRF